MVRRLLVGLVAAGLLLVGAPALAQPPVTTTTVEKNLVETFVDVIPSCEEGGPLYTITTTSNLVEHETVFEDGRVNATFTFTAHGTGSDGSTFKNHATEHFNQRPDGTVNEFFHCH